MFLSWPQRPQQLVLTPPRSPWHKFLLNPPTHILAFNLLLNLHTMGNKSGTTTSHLCSAQPPVNSTASSSSVSTEQNKTSQRGVMNSRFSLRTPLSLNHTIGTNTRGIPMVDWQGQYTVQMFRNSTHGYSDLWSPFNVLDSPSKTSSLNNSHTVFYWLRCKGAIPLRKSASIIKIGLRPVSAPPLPLDAKFPARFSPCHHWSSLKQRFTQVQWTATSGLRVHRASKFVKAAVPR